MAAPRARPHKKPRPRQAAFQDRRLNEDGKEIVRIFGLHAAAAALQNPARKITNVVATENAQRRLADAIASRGAKPETVTPRQLDKVLGADTVHQGVLLETLALEEPALADIATAAQTKGPVVLLDQVTDPHNVGAVLRSAAVFGAAGLVMTRRHSPALSGALAKTASGALEVVPVHLAGNLARAIETLKDHGTNVIGLAGDADDIIDEIDLTGACALVLGAEGKGLRQLTRQTCTRLARIEGSASLASLNVSNAAAISLHLSAMRRRK